MANNVKAGSVGLLRLAGVVDGMTAWPRRECLRRDADACPALGFGRRVSGVRRQAATVRCGDVVVLAKMWGCSSNSVVTEAAEIRQTADSAGECPSLTYNVPY